MADKRISELPLATALDSTELTAIEQQGTAKKATLDSIAELVQSRVNGQGVAAFFINPDTGILYMARSSNYTGVEFRLTDDKRMEAYIIA